MAMRSWLDKIPLELGAILTGVLVIGAGTVPWAVLVSMNLKMLPAVPWSVIVMAAYLWLLVKYLNGWGWPRELSEARRRALRIARPPQRVWRWSLIAGGLAALSLRAMSDVARRLSPHPGQDLVPPEMLAKYPFTTVLLMLLMTAAVAGIAEEAGARGYMQAPLERRYGPGPAIGIVGLIFALMHFRVGAPDLWPWLLFIPLYVLASILFGVLAWQTNSTLPGMICHFLFDAAGMLRYWWGGIPESVWEVGYDSLFRAECALALVFALPAIWAYRRLHVVASRRTTS
jgi:membrane protease YdiL (CAAX protease family)